MQHEELLDLGINFLDATDSDDFEYIYRGHFTDEITQSILNLAEVNLQRTVDKTIIQRRVYFIMVEGLQNITRHQDEAKLDRPEAQGIFFVQKKTNKYYITTGNVIENSKVAMLKERMDTINSLDKEELKDYYKQQLHSGVISKKGGAGLGLIEMARKSGNKLIYDFKKISEQVSFFYFQTEVPTSAEELEESWENKHEDNHSIEEIKLMHERIIENDISLMFRGGFNQENLLVLLTIIKGHMDNSPISIKVYNIMVEMIQNIVKHGDSERENRIGHPGAFFISVKDSDFLLTAVNLVASQRYPTLQQQVAFVNELKNEELNDFYNKVLLDFDTEDSKKTGLGFLDIRIKSNNLVNYKFAQKNANFYYFALQAMVSETHIPPVPLSLQATEDTPEVRLDQSEGIFEFEGQCLPEDAISFFIPIFNWFAEYAKKPNAETILSFKLDYFNTASSKQIIKLLLTVQEMEKNSRLLVKWHYRQHDDDMESSGTRFEKLSGIKFEIIEQL